MLSLCPQKGDMHYGGPIQAKVIRPWRKSSASEARFRRKRICDNSSLHKRCISQLQCTRPTCRLARCSILLVAIASRLRWSLRGANDRMDVAVLRGRGTGYSRQRDRGRACSEPCMPKGRGAILRTNTSIDDSLQPRRHGTAGSGRASSHERALVELVPRR
jgi:hypothetical protein